MKVDCPNCNKVYHIPDERLPIGKKLSFHCPACKGPMELDLRSASLREDLLQSSQTPYNRQSKSPVLSPDTVDRKTSAQALKKRILQNLTESLPPMPQIVFKAQEVMSNPNSSLKQLASLIATDQAIAFRILKLANSAYYGMAGKVNSIGHATVLLGSKALSEIIIMAGTSNLLGKALKGYRLKSEDLWRHSLAVGIGSRMISNQKAPELADDAFTAGIIHDAGKIMLDGYISERKEAFEEFMSDGEQTFLSAEEKILGLDHPEIGSEICKKWGLPDAMTAAIRYHHYPSLSQGNKLAYIIHAADYIAMMTGIGNNIDN
ncbi:MAG: HDOD domain-containing protein, partial [Thermodesulfobacteriota bacterium]|nr:HDOD domain-containing protein [Thermodesulfobacteriota bacterium]